MGMNAFRGGARRKPESGQAMLFVLLGLGIFLIGAMAFAIDMSHLWFRRQMAQTAADAACTAGAMDLLVDATNGGTTNGWDLKNDPNPFDCNTPTSKTGKTATPCQYAIYNGFNSSVSASKAASGTLGDNVSFNWSPVTVAPSGVSTPPVTVAPNPFMQVIVTDNSPTFFAGLLGTSQQSIRGVAVCGVTQSAAPIPILVLDTQTPAKPVGGSQPAALNVQGTPTIQIFGGPTRSIQDNSAASAASCGANNCSVNSPWGTASIDLSKAGPLGTGADMAVSGAPTAAPGGFNGGTTGHWIAPAAPIGDPFAQVCYPGQATNCTTTNTVTGSVAPGVPSAPSGVTATNGSTSTVCTAAQVVGGSCNVRYTENGCPDTGGCVLYEPGAYSAGISVQNKTAIFDPGLYYLTGGLGLNSNSMARPGTGPGDGSGGITFYFKGTGTVSVAANSGSKTIDSFNTLLGPVSAGGTRYAGATTATPYYYGVQCIHSGPGTSIVPANLQGGGAGVNIAGNILLGPCTGYYGDPLGTTESATVGEQRFFLFFQDRSATAVLPNFGGGGQFLLAGTMYFHSCGSQSGDLAAGVQCTPPPSPPSTSSYYQDIFSLGGNSGAQTYVLGDIIADNLTLQGSSGILMDLNPTNAFNILKASLYQ